MKKVELEIQINAPREAVWDAIVNREKYRLWTAAFDPTSDFEGGWNKGDKIYFISTDEQEEKRGMVAEIAESTYPEFISIKHIGQLIDGVEDTTSEEVKKWGFAYENYSLEKTENNQTLFKVSVDTDEEYYDMFMEMWPSALNKLKEISEGK